MRLLAFAFSLVLALPLAAVEAPHKQLYTCGMHPQVIREQPGDCPICGMRLQPILAGAAQAQVSSIKIDAATVQRMNLRTALVTRGPVAREVRTVGVVAQREDGLRDVTLKYESWIERLHAAATGIAVREGDPLAEVYSPELHAAELNYLVALRGEGGESGPLARSVLARLRLMDLPEDEISAIAKSGEAPRTRTVRAPASGLILEKMAVTGQMMKPGERLYRLADLSSVWVLGQVYESDLPFVHEGMEVIVEVGYGERRRFEGRVDRLLPQVDEQTRAVAARIVLANPDGFLRPGMYAELRLRSQARDSAVLVPEEAVLRSGERATVFVAQEGGSFEPRAVEIGLRDASGLLEVVNGLAEGERVVSSGQFMLDSESQLREAIQKMLRPAVLPSQAEPAPAPAAGDKLIYKCPMEEDAEVVSDKPGKCPKCGMKLVPRHA